MVEDAVSRKENRYRETIEYYLRLHSNPDLDVATEEAKSYFEDIGVADLNLLEKLRESLESELRERVRQIRSPYTLSKAHEDWYNEDKHLGIHWPALASYLTERKGWTVDSVSKASRDVVAELANPVETEFDVRGLVVGYVQSGKTANMTAVIARAVDAGYNMIVVLAGTTNKLRQQTQVRLESDLIARNPNNWQQLTKRNEYDSEGALVEDGDYQGEVSKQLPRVSKDVAIIAVIKKNNAQLKRLVTDIQGTKAPVRNQLRMLVIDDESDQASPSAGRTDDEPTPTNYNIRSLLASLPTVSYLGYTATPFANVLINPFRDNVQDEDENDLENLYPRNFIISLPKPKGYFGAEEIFGRDPADAEDEGSDGIDAIRHIDAADLKNLHPSDREMALEEIPSLRNAILWFFLVVAARLARGHSDQHTSMLIHTSHRINDHSDLQSLVGAEVNRIKSEHKSTCFLEELYDLWDEESGKVSAADFDNSAVSFDDLRVQFSEASERLSVVVENSSSEARLSYEDVSPSAVIAIGGNILARGLTLEGLAVTYFTRNSKQYDTLLQMGRWFGYRDGYEDLVRLWLPRKVSEAFRQLALVEYELREEIQEYSERKARPLDFAVRIRTLPGLQVTNRHRMRNVRTADIDYRGFVLQTIRFPRLQKEILEKNWEAGSDLISRAEIDESQLVGSVGAQAVIDFFRTYEVDRSHRDLSSEWLEEYIRKNTGVLSEWSVSIMQTARSERPISDEVLGGITPRLIRRSRLEKTDDQTADIKALMSRADVMVDVPEDQRPEDPDWRKWDWSRLKNHRENVLGPRPLILLYPIDSRSEALNGRSRVPLDAAHKVLGVGLVFPLWGVEASNKPTKFIQVNLANSGFDDGDDEDDVEAQGE